MCWRSCASDVSSSSRARPAPARPGSRGASRTRSARATRIQFHPARTYEDFVVGLFPRPVGQRARVRGAAGRSAASPTRPPSAASTSWSIDEINRADLGRVLGESILLFEAGEATARCPPSARARGLPRGAAPAPQPAGAGDPQHRRPLDRPHGRRDPSSLRVRRGVAAARRGRQRASSFAQASSSPTPCRPSPSTPTTRPCGWFPGTPTSWTRAPTSLKTWRRGRVAHASASSSSPCCVTTSTSACAAARPRPIAGLADRIESRLLAET
jgi:hypothetical protein